MTPDLGQGAAQALLDVAALVAALAAHPLPEALLAYERARKRTAERIVWRSRMVGRVAQASHPLSARLRDAVAANLPQAVLAREMARVLR